MVVGNTFIKKDAEKLITYKSRNCTNVVDYVMVLKKVMKNVRDVKVIPEKKCFLQHMLLIMVLTL